MPDLSDLRRNRLLHSAPPSIEALRRPGAEAQRTKAEEVGGGVPDAILASPAPAVHSLSPSVRYTLQFLADDRISGLSWRDAGSFRTLVEARDAREKARTTRTKYFGPGVSLRIIETATREVE